MSVENWAKELTKTKVARDKVLIKVLVTKGYRVSLGSFENMREVFEFQSRYCGSVPVNSYFGDLNLFLNFLGYF